MAATVKGTTGLVFGVTTVSGVIMQDYTSDINGSITEVTDEDDDVVGFALHHTGRAEVSGSYIFTGDDIGAIGDKITEITALGVSGGLYIYGFGRKYSNNGFCSGTFKAIAVNDIS